MKPQIKQRILVFLAFFLFFFLTRVIAHFNLTTGLFDQYFFDNPLWNTAHGKLLYSTIEGRSFLGTHFSPILIVFSLPYFLWASSMWTFLLQSLIVAGLVTIIFRFAQEQLDKEGTGLILLLLATNVTLRYMGFHDLHMDVVITALLTLALYILLTYKNIVWPTILLLLGFLAKENAGFLVSSFGLFILLTRKEKLLGAALLVLGIGTTVFIVKNIIPQFNPTEGFIFGKYYAQFGSNISEQIITIISQPLKTLSYLITSANIFFIFIMLAPLAFLPLFARPLLIIALLPLLQNMISNYSFTKDFTTQYSYIFVPILFFTTILGIKHLKESNSWERLKGRIRKTIYFFALLSLIAFILLDLRQYFTSEQIFSAHKLMKEIPSTASVSADFHLMAHLQYRDHLSVFPEVNNADYVIFADVDRWLLNQPKDDVVKVKQMWANKDYGRIVYYIVCGFKNPKPEDIAAIAKMQKNQRYKLVKEENGIFLYAKKR